jgi:hypothetical protein
VTGRPASILSLHHPSSPGFSSENPHYDSRSLSSSTLYEHKNQLSSPPATAKLDRPKSRSQPQLVAYHAREDWNAEIKTRNPSGDRDALEFLLSISPSNAPALLPFTKSVFISTPSLNVSFRGAVLKLPGQMRTLYIDGKSAEALSLRERQANDLSALSLRFFFAHF